MAEQSVSADQIHQFLAYGALGFGVAGILALGALTSGAFAAAAGYALTLD